MVILTIAATLLGALNLYAIWRFRAWVVDPIRARMPFAHRWLGNPLIFVLALDVLAVDFMTLEQGSAAAAWRDSYVTPVIRRINYGGFLVALYEGPDGELCAWEYYQNPNGAPDPDSKRMSAICLVPRPDGLWGNEIRVTNYLPLITSSVPGISDESLRTPQVLNLVADYIEEHDIEYFPGHAAGIRAGKTTQREIRWIGVAHTAGAALVSTTALVTLPFMPVWKRRRDRACGAKWCLKCRYPREGIAGERCPECGVEFVVSGAGEKG